MTNDFPFITGEEISEFYKSINLSNNHNEKEKVFIISGNVKNPITVEKLNDWIQKLESGVYTHGKFSLYKNILDKVSHCCLGVLAEKENVLESFNSEIYKYFKPSEYESIDKDFYKDLENSSLTMLEDSYFIDMSLQETLMGINDNPDNDNYDNVIAFLKEIVLPKIKKFELAQQVEL